MYLNRCKWVFWRLLKMKKIIINIFILFRSYFAQCIHCSKLLSMLKYSFLRRFSNELWKKRVWLLTVNVNFQGLKADLLLIYLHLIQFSYLFTNYFITVVFNLIYYFYSLHLGNIELSKDGFVWIALKICLKARMIYALFCSLSDFSLITS